LFRLGPIFSFFFARYHEWPFRSLGQTGHTRCSKVIFIRVLILAQLARSSTPSLFTPAGKIRMNISTNDKNGDPSPQEGFPSLFLQTWGLCWDASTDASTCICGQPKKMQEREGGDDATGRDKRGDRKNWAPTRI
jgi:hypothetical protein